jgi:hypothetical protein
VQSEEAAAVVSLDLKYVLLLAGVLRCHGLLLVSLVPQVLFSMYFDRVAASLGEYCARCCRPELHKHYSLLMKVASRFVVWALKSHASQFVEL